MYISKKDMEYRDFLKSKYIEIKEKYGKVMAEDIAELIIKFDEIILGTFLDEEQAEEFIKNLSKN